VSPGQAIKEFYYKDSETQKREWDEYNSYWEARNHGQLTGWTSVPPRDRAIRVGGYAVARIFMTGVFGYFFGRVLLQGVAK